MLFKETALGAHLDAMTTLSENLPKYLTKETLRKKKDREGVSQASNEKLRINIEDAETYPMKPNHRDVTCYGRTLTTDYPMSF